MPAEDPLTFTMQIETISVGCRTYEAVAQILERAAEQLRELSCTIPHLSYGVRDINGNSVGNWTLRNGVRELMDLDGVTDV